MVNYDNKNWLKLLFSFKGSVVNEIYPKVIFFTLNSLLITLFYEEVYKIKFSPVPFTIIGGVLGFLLVFRTNTSYDRYWEGRKLWGEITNQTRNITVKTAALLHDDLKHRDRIFELQKLFLYCIKEVVRDGIDIKRAEGILKSEQIEVLKKSKIPHILVISYIFAEVADLRKQQILGDAEFIGFSSNIDILTAAAGGIERIRKTPIPISYALHIKRLLFIFCFFVPFGFVDTIGWVTIPAVAFITYAFMGIEEIGVEIEDPFGTDQNDLPVDDIVLSLENCIDELKK